MLQGVNDLIAFSHGCQWKQEAVEVPGQADLLQVLPASHRVQVHQACHGERLQHPAAAPSFCQELGWEAGYQYPSTTFGQTLVSVPVCGVSSDYGAYLGPVVA